MKYQNSGHKAAATQQLNRQLNLLQQDICLPAAVLKQSAVEHNLQWMQRFANSCGVSLAPHGKTSMTPWLFQQQLASGAWGITVATAYQAQVAAQAGAQQIILANQLVGRANMALVAAVVGRGCNIYVCVDSHANASALSAFFAAEKLTLPVLIELGVPGGRCGCRTNQQATELAQHIATLPGLSLAGIEFYEGVIKSDDTERDVRQFVQRAAALAKALTRQQLLKYQQPLISGAGSVWYDIVATELNKATLPDTMRIVLRPGCYISHDKGIYEQAQQQLMSRSHLACRLGDSLSSALELAAYVQSLPEPGLAVLGFGKRDAAFDAGLPQAIAIYRDGKLLSDKPEGCETIKVMDQHAFWRYSGTIQPHIGDIVLLSTSHPCLTFDKWRSLWLVDDHYNLLQSVDTFF
ncbi:amino acid deaminase [Rheinheimera aquimaris]|jgi:D-serine dehydratase|uniref:amino acid deaminase n=1 Tax=Rheinheimera aquimaris TaxID=412437 RepID=UPI000E8E9D5D|nr:amino acid deaminase [Rheinheimera aquimaris]HBN89530.1 amino acid deaminase [Rheinheimera sp.]|tara:strand:+ start:15773 stop:16996 length:1224 start_codon:yes stop_codon:yes gene_type:complete